MGRLARWVPSAQRWTLVTFGGPAGKPPVNSSPKPAAAEASRRRPGLSPEPGRSAVTSGWPGAPSPGLPGPPPLVLWTETRSRGQKDPFVGNASCYQTPQASRNNAI